jgi:hypothetical protein
MKIVSMLKGSRILSGRLGVVASVLSVLSLLSIFAVSQAGAAPTTIAGEGEGAGQVNDPTSVAVDQATGDLYVADTNNRRVDKFGPSGEFLSAWGTGLAVSPPASVAVDQSTEDIYVADEGHSRILKYSSAGQFILMFGKNVDQGPHHPGNVCKAEYETEGDICGAGDQGTSPDEFNGQPNPMAIDASGNVWVGNGDQVEQFSSEGVFISEVTPPTGVNETSVVSFAIDTNPLSMSFGDIYAVDSSKNARQMIIPPAAGSFTLTFEGQTTVSLPYNASDRKIAQALEALSTIGPGNLQSYSDELYEFTGALSHKNVPQIVASSGSVTISQEGFSAKVFKFEPDGNLVYTADTLGHPASVALGAGGSDLFVGDQTNPYRFLQFEAATGSQTKIFGYGEVQIAGPSGGGLSFGGPEYNGIAWNEDAQRLDVANNDPGGTVQAFPVPAEGPVITGESAGSTTPTSATLEGILNPQGSPTEYHFEYIDKSSYGDDGDIFGAGTADTPSVSLAANFNYENVSAALGTGALVPGTTYEYRLLAKDESGHKATGEVKEFETQPATEIRGASTISVTSTGASLEAQINPLGVDAHYSVQYGTSLVYGSQSQVVDVGAGSSAVTVRPQIHGLQPDTTYHYRFLATDERGGISFSSASPDLTFSTQSPSGASALPDGREWEQVSPVDKYGATIFSLSHPGVGAVQAAAGGDAVTYLASSSTEPEPRGKINTTQVFSMHKTDGSPWSTRDLSTPHESPIDVSNGDYDLFSSNLSLGVRDMQIGQFTSLAPEVFPPDTESTPYLRHNFECQTSSSTCFTPLLTSAPGYADVEEGTEFGGRTTFMGANPDFQNLIVSSSVELTGVPIGAQPAVLYEYSTVDTPIKAPHLVSVLPAGEGGKAVSGGLGGHARLDTRGAVSTDGSRVFWSVVSTVEHPTLGLYMRDTVREETIRLDLPEVGAGQGEVSPEYQLASANGERVYFTDSQRLTDSSSAKGQDLYECRIVETEGHLSCELRDLTSGNDGESASVQGSIAASSDNGTVLYFVANGALTETPNARHERAVPGDCNLAGVAGDRCNLYVWREDPSTGVTQVHFVATLSFGDRNVWATEAAGSIRPIAARVSPNGRYFSFMSELSLTGYDNRDARSGQLDKEVFLYDSQTEKLVCASCNPSGVRPAGVEATEGVGDLFADSAINGGMWYAATIPAWTLYENHTAFSQSRFLSDSGRLFFDSSDSLVPQDSNGNQDVYEYEPPAGEGHPFGDTCTSQSTAYSARNEGCIGLISSGTSPAESVFLDASESGNDVFFLTASNLAATDIDGAFDVYDAHVCSPESLCSPTPSAPPPACVGDACQSPAAAPEDPTPGSLSFQGPGNIVPALAEKPKTTSKKLTRAQKLTVALKTCKKKPKKRRAVCQKQAKKRYGRSK